VIGRGLRSVVEQESGVRDSEVQCVRRRHRETIRRGFEIGRSGNFWPSRGPAGLLPGASSRRRGRDRYGLADVSPRRHPVRRQHGDDFSLLPLSDLRPLWTYKTGGMIAASATVVGGGRVCRSWTDMSTPSTQHGRADLEDVPGITSAPACSPPQLGISSIPAVVGGVVYVGGRLELVCPQRRDRLGALERADRRQQRDGWSLQTGPAR